MPLLAPLRIRATVLFNKMVLTSAELHMEMRTMEHNSNRQPVSVSMRQT